ncbi:YwqJ-related putative deaminase [Tahibacter amnicola]|uniref:YwqJ-related putative deaminase n=2 Tax=Tahibacter amnicola TaxID=2976241 RepID=A0ABY6BKZ8_9GAMM|nr:RHS repeat-associated core domain-containing protein [Tahibacter amnicola]UXI70686.1 YwqJ-related putative deaminase [Tahibacter amnicola]
MTRAVDSRGQILHTKDAKGGISRFWTDANGKVIALQDPQQVVSTSTYDALGRRTSMTDADQGTWQFRVNAFGEMLQQTDARNVVNTVTARDALGRVKQGTIVPPVSLPAGLSNDVFQDDYTYDPANAIGQIKDVTRRRGTSRTPSQNPEVWKSIYAYDAMSRPTGATTTISEGTPVTLTHSTDYDGYNRPSVYTYPSGLAVETTYTATGHRETLTKVGAATPYWKATAANSWGHTTGEIITASPTLVLTGSHVDYGSTGQSKSMTWKQGAAEVDKVSYTYDSFGNLATQNRTAQGASAANESYQYDTLQRLIKATTNGVPTSYGYTASGNIRKKTDFSIDDDSAYTYNQNGCGPHGVSRVMLSGGGMQEYHCDANGNVIRGTNLTVLVDAENRPKTISRTSTTTDIIFKHGFEAGPGQTSTPSGTDSWAYSPLGERVYSVTSRGARYYGDSGYERVGTTHIHELGPVIVTKVGATETVTIALRDRLGSTIASIDATTRAQRSYDAFGKARNGDFGDRGGTLGLPRTIHGFTKHEHADDVALIHMGGRVYDYNLGRFLAVDPIVQSPTQSQSLNPYSYVLNNPLSGKDPSGYQSCSETPTQGITAGMSCTTMVRDSRSANKLGVYTTVVVTDGPTMGAAESAAVSVGVMRSNGAGTVGGTGNGAAASQPSTKSSSADIGALNKFADAANQGARSAMLPLTVEMGDRGVSSERTFIQNTLTRYKTGYFVFYHTLTGVFRPFKWMFPEIGVSDFSDEELQTAATWEVAFNVSTLNSGLILKIASGTRATVYSGLARPLSEAYAEALRGQFSKTKLPTATSAAVDVERGRFYFAYSGSPPADIHPYLRGRMPQKSLQLWSVDNCAEFSCVNKALHDGAKIRNLEVHTVYTRNGAPVPRCLNCVITTDGARATSD